MSKFSYTNGAFLLPMILKIMTSEENLIKQMNCEINMITKGCRKDKPVTGIL
jgi:hypothetical protein